METTVPITAITVRSRIRKTLPNIEKLAKSIEEVGLIHPPAVHEDGGEFVLIAGQRRLEACKSLGWDEIQVRVCDGIWDALRTLQAEAQENTEREPLNAAEMHAFTKDLLPKAKAAANDRQRLAGEQHGRGMSIGSGGPPEPISSNEARDEVGRALGVSGRTVDEVEFVYEVAADKTQPEAAREVAQKAVDAWESGDKDAPSIWGAADKTRKAGGTRPRARKTDKPVVPEVEEFTPDSRPRHSKRTYRQLFDEMLVELESRCTGLPDAYFPQKVWGIAENVDEFDLWVKRLEMARAALTSYVRQLKETVK